MVSLKYVTMKDVAQALGFESVVPSWDVGGSATNEEVGTGDGSNSIFYLDQKNIIGDTYTLFHGATSATTDTLTETTHYTLDLDSGKITLTAAGITLLSTNKIFAKYSYLNNGMLSTHLQNIIAAAELKVENITNAVYIDGTANNPAYPSTEEVQASQGFFQERIMVQNKPLIDLSSTLASDIISSVTSIALASGDGSKFPTSGKLIIGSEVISYTGISIDTLTGVTRGAEGTDAEAHSSGDKVHSTILFVSGTPEGSPVNWIAQTWDTRMHADEFGLLYRFKERFFGVASLNNQLLVKSDVANRIRIIYYYGYSVIPEDIKRLVTLLSRKMLAQDSVGKALIAGRNEFRPEMFNADREEIDRIVNSYVILPMENT